MVIAATKSFSEQEELKPGFQHRLYDILHSSTLEYVMSLIILGNFVLIIAETNIRAQESDDKIPLWMDVASWFVLVLFTLELIARLYVARLNFFMDPWNLFDFVIIFTDLIFSFIAEIFESILPISLLRILRLAKVCRISKVFRIFPELRLMVGGLIGAMRAILWGTVLMVIAMLVCAVLAVQFIHPLNKKLAEQGLYDGCYKCEDKFSTVQDAVMTFWQQILAGDSWGQVTIPLIDAYPATAIYFGLVFLLLALALHNLILGVIVDVAQESRKRLAADTEKEKTVLRMESQTHLLQMCRDMDTDKSGDLTRDELFQAYSDNPDFSHALQDLDVKYSDLDVVWLLLDKDRSGYVDYDEFVTELYNLRSSESQFMMTYIKYYITVIKDRILDEFQVVEKGMKAVEKSMQGIEKEVEVVENLELQRSRDDEKQGGDRPRAGSKEAANSDGARSQEGNDNRGMERSIHHMHHMSEAIFNDLVQEIRQSEHRLTAILETIDAKVDFSLSDQMKRMGGSMSWSLALPCQSVSNGSEKRIIQTPANMKQLKLIQTPPNSKQPATGGVLAVPHNSGPGAPKGSTDYSHEGGQRWH